MITADWSAGEKGLLVKSARSNGTDLTGSSENVGHLLAALAIQTGRFGLLQKYC